MSFGGSFSTHIDENRIDIISESVALERCQIWTEIISWKRASISNRQPCLNGYRHLRGTHRTSRFFSRLSPRWPPAQSPMENLGVCLQIWAYSFWYSLSFVAGSFTLFCFSFSDRSLTGKNELPHTTYSSKVSYTNLYCSTFSIRPFRDWRSFFKYPNT